MTVSFSTKAWVGFNIYCAAENITMTPAVFVAGFTAGALAGLIYNLILRYEVFKKCNTLRLESDQKEFLTKEIQKLNPFSDGFFGTILSYAACKVNQGAITSHGLYFLSLFSGVPLGFATGRAFAVLPIGDRPKEYAAVLAKASF
jgi:hypothetical protein